MPALKSETIAAVDVGSNSLRMKIVEVKGNGKLTTLEDLRKTINLGRDSFAHGIIRTDTVIATCNILKDFHKVMREYRVKSYRAVSTSAIREAENRDYILDQIKIKTGLEIEVINNSQERYLTYKAIRDRMDNYAELRKQGLLILDIGAGGVETSLYKDGFLNFTENVKIGSLRLREILYELERRTLNFPEIMEQFVESKIYLLRPLIEEKKLKNYICLGGELKVISVLCGHKVDGVQKISMQEVNELYAVLKGMTTQGIVQKYGISTERVEVLLPSLIILKKFFEVVKTEYLFAPLVSLRDGLIADIADERFQLKRRADFIEDVIYSVRQLGRKYNYDEKHSRQVERLALSIFDQTKKLHAFGERERFYLQIAAILHDVGKFIGLNGHDTNSYNIIYYSDIMGLSDRDRSIVSNIAGYHSEDEPDMRHDKYRNLSYEDRLIVSKLCSILMLADSLDISHKQSIKKLEVEIDDALNIKVETDSDIVLEQWVFENKIEFFHKVYGIRPIVKKRGR